MNDIYKVLTREYVEHVVRQEMSFVAEGAEEHHIRVAARQIMHYYTEQGPEGQL